MSLQNFKPIFSIILQIVDLECHAEMPPKVAYVMFGLFFMKFRKLKSLHRENKKLNRHKTFLFLLQYSFSILMGQSYFQNICFLNF